MNGLQKTLTNKIANCIDIGKKHNWKLIDFTKFSYTFKCENCQATKEETRYNIEKKVRRR